MQKPNIYSDKIYICIDFLLYVAGPMLQILTLAGEHIDKSIAG